MMDSEPIGTPKKINFPLVIFIVIAITALAVIFIFRSSPEPEGAVPVGPAATDPDVTKPQSPERSGSPGSSADTTLVPPSLK